MDTIKVVEVLKTVRAKAKGIHESARVLTGVAGHKLFASQTSRQPLGKAVPFEPRPYRPGSLPYPVTICTPSDGHYMTTFFDVDAVSPSGRYLAVTRVPFIWRIPYPGDIAQVCVIDLEDNTCTAVYDTKGWGAQLGANVQWGADDDTLYCNDILNGQATGVEINRLTLAARSLGGPIYGLTPDRRYSFSGNLQFINAGIIGYGVPEGIVKKRRPSDRVSSQEGIWRTDLATGESTLFLSLADIVQSLPEQESFRGGTYHVFNVKVNRQNSRLLAVIFTRNTPGHPGWPVQLITCNLDGTDIRLAMPNRIWRLGGHHPNWAPCGNHIIMNLRGGSEAMRFVRFNYDGTELSTIAPGHKGSGHPSLDPSETFLVTDSYTAESFIDAAGEVPIRLIDLRSNTETELARIFTNRILGPRRVDPHPVWSPDGKKVFFNGVIERKRQVLAVDLSSLA